jgi:hypothetical protein
MVDNGNTLEVLVTVDDSDTYNQPWQGLRRYRRAGTARRADLRRGKFPALRLWRSGRQDVGFLSRA